MTITITPESKTNISITNESKPSVGTFGSDPDRTFADGGTFGEPAMVIHRESKNSITISNESKT